MGFRFLYQIKRLCYSKEQWHVLPVHAFKRLSTLSTAQFWTSRDYSETSLWVRISLLFEHTI